ncbi:hypothetical protein D9619_007711 [Psilocybe cf. subviscida]|uniref:Uncharacterized protein n=1 Tax=Psilocybe cf. subviscida TaxID=2480587 RepID=A0A8H5AU67_9AGAR|nr:hypothetical protein D9619_007711 [Psilocybe cf. subviscida]
MQTDCSKDRHSRDCDSERNRERDIGRDRCDSGRPRLRAGDPTGVQATSVCLISSLKNPSDDMCGTGDALEHSRLAFVLQTFCFSTLTP